MHSHHFPGLAIAKVDVFGALADLRGIVNDTGLQQRLRICSELTLLGPGSAECCSCL